jgi:hypothetical protein
MSISNPVVAPVRMPVFPLGQRAISSALASSLFCHSSSNGRLPAQGMGE